MPGPDPNSLWIEHDGERYIVNFESYFWTGNNGNRRARAFSMPRRLSKRTWRCLCCGDDLPEYVRSDAIYCRESCRKRAARSRRKVAIEQ